MGYERTAIAAARIVSLAVALAGSAVLAGWFLPNPDLTRLYLPGPTVKTNGAISLVASALANLLLISADRWRWLRRLGMVVALVPLVVGGLTLSQHVGGWNLGIDQLLASEPEGAVGTVSPNRMGPPASLMFLLLGVSMLLSSSTAAGPRRVAHALAITAAVIPLLPLLGYVYGFSQLYAVARFTGIALSMALSLLALGLAVIAGRPREGLAALLCRPDEVGTLGRRVFPVAIVLPFAMGGALTRLLRAEVVDGPFAIAAMAVVLIAAMATLVWRTGLRLAASLDARLAAERALSESARSLREVDRQKSEFMATLSHELRNPLAPIRFALDLLDGPAEEARRARATIRRQVQHLTRLIDDLLDLTRISRNKLQLQPGRIALAEVVRDAVDAVTGEITRGGQNLVYRLPDEPTWLHADPDRVVQILANLLNNAARHTDAGGTITIGATLTPSDVVIIVRDTGVGIAAGDLERVFDSFVQVGASRHGGLGIGLALVKGLAELHGGSVEARSDGPGTGAEFRVRLPRAATPLPAKPPHLPAPTLDPSRILVVDDNRDAADMLATVLTAMGHEVLVSYDAVDVLRRAPAFHPGVGLLDIGMPGMNGYELAAALRQLPETKGAFLVAITGWGQEEDRRRAIDAGFDAHMTKPADPDEIIALVAARAAKPELSVDDSPQPLA